jgi:hypothetical protein
MGFAERPVRIVSFRLPPRRDSRLEAGLSTLSPACTPPRRKRITLFMPAGDGAPCGPLPYLRTQPRVGKARQLDGGPARSSGLGPDAVLVGTNRAASRSTWGVPLP